MHTAAALMFFIPVALAAALALASLGRRGPQPVFLPAVRTVTLLTLAVCYTAALFRLGAS